MADKEHKLSIQEIVYAAAILGAKTLFGLPDTFLGLSEQKRNEEIERVKSLLLSKNAAEMDFDGVFSLTPTLEEKLVIIALCDASILVDAVFSGVRQPKKRYYIKGSAVLELVGDDDGYDDGYDIFPVTKADVATSLQTQFVIKNIDTAWTPATLHKSVIEAAKRSGNEDAAIQALVADGCSEDVAAIIAKGLMETANFYSLYAIEGEDHKIRKLFVISADEGALEMRPDAKTSEETVDFVPITSTQAHQWIEELLQTIASEAQAYEVFE